MSFVNLTAEDFEKFFSNKGFEKTTVGNEIVYTRRHHKDSRYTIKVYTTLRIGAHNVRNVGEDAIRVCAVFVNGSFSRGAAKTKRVYRTGTVEGVLERTLNRMREAYEVCNEQIRSNRNNYRSNV